MPKSKFKQKLSLQIFFSLDLNFHASVTFCVSGCPKACTIKLFKAPKIPYRNKIERLSLSVTSTLV